MPSENPLPFGGLTWIRRGSRLPIPIKRVLLAHYWPIKALTEDFQDYTAELVGKIPVHSFRLWWYRHICGVRIGEYSSIHRECRMYRPNQIHVGNHSIINYGTLLDGRRGLYIGDNDSISEGTVILTLEHDIDAPDFGLKGDPVRVEDRAFIGSYARILPGVTIGEGAVVAVGAVVTRDVAPYTVVGGVPALYIRDRARQLNYQLNFRKRFG